MSDVSFTGTPNSETGTTNKVSKNAMHSEGTIVRLLYKFSESTTFHGYRFVFGRDTHIIRRILWLILVLTALSFLCYQITDRITYYYQWPITTSSQIRNNGSIPFPAVTICNLNTFKISEVQKNKYADIIDELGTDTNHTNVGTLDLNIPMMDVIEKTMHKKSDLIKQCHWLKEECSHRNFTETLTEDGVCFTFNSREADMELISNEVGTGLQLILNTETYEYVVGKNTGAGIKLIIHDKDLYPSVAGGGLMVSPDSDTRVSVKYTEYEYLGPPYGQCQDNSLRYLNFSYSVEACELECLSDYTNRVCGCIDPYMPGPYPKCEASQSVLCVSGIRSSLEYQQNQCLCRAPCSETHYSTASSYSSLSDFAVSVKEKQLNIAEIQKAVSMASQSRMNSRYNFMKISKDDILMAEILFNNFDTEMLTMEPYITNAIVLMNKLKESCYERVSYSISSLSVMKAVRDEFREFLDQCRALDDHGIRGILSLHQIILTKYSSKRLEKLIRTTGNEIIISIQEICSCLVTLNNGYKQHVKGLLESRPWLKIRVDFDLDVENIMNVTERIIPNLKDIFILTPEQETELLDLIKAHSQIFRTTCGKLAMAHTIISNEVEDFESIRSMAPICFTVISKIDHYSKNLKMTFESWYLHFEEIKREFETLVEMHVLAENETNPEALLDIDKYLDNLRIRRPFNEFKTAIWHWAEIIAIAADELPFEIDRVFFLINNHMSSDISETMLSFNAPDLNQHADRISASVHAMEQIFTKWLRKFTTSMDAMKIDAKFYRKNFIHLHISYQEMGYQRIVQRPSYDYVALASDIGGNMGLLVGGSVISLFEVFDMVCISLCVVLNRRLHQNSQAQQKEMTGLET